MTNPPTLSEMRHSLGEVAPVEPITPPTLSEMMHILEDSDAVLEHYGIKGMKWGIRRSLRRGGGPVAVKNTDGTDAGSINPSSSSAAKVLKSMRAGETMLVDDADTGETHVLTKQADGSFKRAKLSADAERFIKTMNKEPDQMSDAELKAANNRAKQLETYNQLFGGGSNKSELERRVEDLALQKKYRDLSRELNPPKKSAVQHLVSGSAQAFSAYKQVDSVMKGDLTNALSSKLGLKPPLSPLDKLKFENELTTLRTKHILDRAEFNDTMALEGRRARGDLPSQATGYADAGKRRARLASEGRHQTNDGFKYKLPA